MSLTNEEKLKLVSLIKKIDSKEIRGEIWHEFIKKFVTVSIEMCVFDNKNRLLLVYRKDEEFDGYHIPGSVINFWETVEEAKDRLIKNEITEPLNLKIKNLESIGWVDIYKDFWFNKSDSRHPISLLFIAKTDDVFDGVEGAGFFEIDDLPENTLDCHKFFIRFIKGYLKDGTFVLGK